ncbi:MAG: DUF3604 domain-containing protein [Myxococcales bacterium]|nr:DUF3604 domain-containing protein [Myxococcales bacterium]
MKRRWPLGFLAGVALVLCAGCGSRPQADEAASAVVPTPGPAPAAAPEILFGDLHVHTTYSWDSFLLSLPVSGGEGAHPPDDACDFARYCADLDFYALTDHAESLSQDHWRASKQSVRRCNARSGEPGASDLVAFMGFEWSQAGGTPESHWGHRCVVFPGTDDASLPARPIGSVDRGPTFGGLEKGMRAAGEIAFADYLALRAARDVCPPDVDTRSLPADCDEIAPTPAELAAKLDEWGLPALVIPHGTAWGAYTPATTSIEKHLRPAQFHAKRQKLIEVMSGHGNSEEYRAWREWETLYDGSRVCRPPAADYLSCCWQAGEITRGRCANPDSAECADRVASARERVMNGWDIGLSRLFPDVASAEWLDCGQCRDCFKPSFSYRPLESVQYAMALSDFSDADAEGAASSGEPLRFRYGFIASSDGHSARPGTGYKQVERMGMMTDGNPAPVTPEQARLRENSLGPIDQRVQSFLFPGGLVAVHSDSRSRDAIFDALERREVYATSGPRIRLWFDLVSAGAAGLASPLPMGSEVALATNPVFEVRAQGSLEQLPGCPERSMKGLARDRLARLCRDECHHPSDVRRTIDRIEVVRIRPQQQAGEPVGALIEDPWRVLDCSGAPAGCTVRFEDRQFAAGGRDALYYVRAIERASPNILGDPLRTVFDADGNAVSIDPCDTVGSDTDCLAPSEERAWSSPIFVDWRAGVSTALRPGGAQG